MPNYSSAPYVGLEGGNLPPGSAIIAANAGSALRTLSARLAGSSYALNVALVDSSGNQIIDISTDSTIQKLLGFYIPSNDYVSLAQDTLTDTYTFKNGGAVGTIVATIVITYTDSGKGTLSSAAITRT